MVTLDLAGQAPLEQAAEDYVHVQKAIAYLTAHWKAQPSRSRPRRDWPNRA